MRRVRPVYEYLIFNGKSSLDFGVKISGSETYKGAERKVETINVAGRNGTLTYDEEVYSNVTQPYDCYLIDNFQSNLEGFRDFLTMDGEYHRLEDTYHPDEFRIARYTGEFEPDVNVISESASFDLEFDCYPQRFLKSGEREIKVGTSLTLKNPTNQIALPKILVYSGVGKIKVNDTEFTINLNEGVTIIDSELQDCYLNNNIPVNSNVSIGDYPKLIKGVNTITCDSNMDVRIIPRWWRR